MNHSKSKYLKVIVIGSAQDGGLPQFAADTDFDRRARAEMDFARLAPSLCIIDDQGRSFLIDVSPDIKLQEARLRQVAEYQKRQQSNPFDGILLTHAHMGHYAGLIHFGREAASTKDVPCYCTSAFCHFLETNAPWRQLVELNNIALKSVEGDDIFEPWPGLSIRVFTVPHRSEYTDTLGISINGKVLYVPDIDHWKHWPQAYEEVKKHEVNLLDASFFSENELPNRDMSKISHPIVTDTLEFFKALSSEQGGNRRLILTHFNHSNPLCDSESEAAKIVDEAGFERADDMQVILLEI